LRITGLLRATEWLACKSVDPQRIVEGVPVEISVIVLPNDSSDQLRYSHNFT
jgi:hypothetical protein